MHILYVHVHVCVHSITVKDRLLCFQENVNVYFTCFQALSLSHTCVLLTVQELFLFLCGQRSYTYARGRAWVRGYCILYEWIKFAKILLSVLVVQ